MKMLWSIMLGSIMLWSIISYFIEAQYAYKCKRPVIPLLVQDGYDPDGWLGLIVGTKLYYKFCNDKDTDLEGLLKGIREIGKIVGLRWFCQHEFQKKEIFNGHKGSKKAPHHVIACYLTSPSSMVPPNPLMVIRWSSWGTFILSLEPTWVPVTLLDA